MSCNKNMETSAELVAPTMNSSSPIKLPEKDIGIPSESIPLVSAAGNAVSGDQPLASEQGAYYPPSSCYDYYYHGYNGNFAQPDDKGYFNTPGSYTGSQQDNASHLYYLPGYGPYSPGYMGVDGKQAYPSSYGSEAFPCYSYDFNYAGNGYGPYLPGYMGVDGKQAYPSSYGSEAFPCYAYDLNYAGNGSTANSAKSGSLRSMVSPSDSGKSNGYNVAKSNTNLRNQQTYSSRPTYQNQSLNPLNKLGSGFQSSGIMGGYHHGGMHSYGSRNPCSFSQYGPVNYQSNARVWNNNYRYKSRENSGRGGEMSEVSRGPRGDNKSSSTKLPAEAEQLPFAVDRDRYNLPDFQTVYENAKFYVIKSYSEDDIHKCIKYDVWSSTPNGNKKLDAGFREADAKTTETGTKCPVFLFFSVNGSGQFVGVAEMIGHVDFSKNMDFWQVDKWNGFFPIKWHIIKDVPNTLLRHIILENNENRAVPNSRDTQEIELKKGLEMLSIFKSYSAKTCVLDDFNFYENREKALKAKRNVGLISSDFEAVEAAKSDASDPSSLVALTQNLSLDSQALQSSI